MTALTKYHVVAMVTIAKHQVSSLNHSKTEKRVISSENQGKNSIGFFVFYLCSLSIYFVPKYLAVVSIATTSNNNNNVVMTLKIA